MNAKKQTGWERQDIRPEDVGTIQDVFGDTLAPKPTELDDGDLRRFEIEDQTGDADEGAERDVSVPEVADPVFRCDHCDGPIATCLCSPTDEVAALWQLRQRRRARKLAGLDP